jgi:hypothetical protein
LIEDPSSRISGPALEYGTLDYISLSPRLSLGIYSTIVPTTQALPRSSTLKTKKEEEEEDGEFVEIKKP